LQHLELLIIHLEFEEISLEWVEGRVAGNVFLGAWLLREVVGRHVGPLFVLNDKIVFQKSCLQMIHRLAVQVSQFLQRLVVCVQYELLAPVILIEEIHALDGSSCFMKEQ